MTKTAQAKCFYETVAKFDPDILLIYPPFEKLTPAAQRLWEKATEHFLQATSETKDNETKESPDAL